MNVRPAAATSIHTRQYRRYEFSFYSVVDLLESIDAWRNHIRWGVCADPVQTLCSIAVARAALLQRI